MEKTGAFRGNQTTREKVKKEVGHFKKDQRNHTGAQGGTSREKKGQKGGRWGANLGEANVDWPARMRWEQWK